MVADALAALFKGLSANAADDAGASSLADALPKHLGGLLQGGVNLDDIDEDDGEAIVSHIFGQNTDSVVSALGQRESAANSSLISKLLPILAPVVMTYLSQQFLGNSRSAKVQPASSGGLGDLLGGLLGGGRR